MFGLPVAINHIAITMPNREAWLKQLAWLRKNNVKFHRRVNHGMTHSVYISDPNGYGVEVLYELPREVWGDDIQGALDYAEPVPTEGDAAFADDTDYPHFKAAPAEVLIDGDTIREVAAPGATVPEGAAEIDVSGHLLHPGLVNAHTHAHG